MTYYQRQFRVPRKRLLQALFSRRSLVLTLRIESDGAFLATVVPTLPAAPRPKPRWHDLDESSEGLTVWE